MFRVGNRSKAQQAVRFFAAGRKVLHGPLKTALNTRSYKLSRELAAVCGSDAMPRTEVTKGIWSYIKTNGLQKQENKRTIVCDEALKQVFEKDEIDMLEIAKRVQKHILQPIDEKFRSVL